MPVLTGEAKTIERPAPLFWHWAGNRAVREGNWKLVWEKGKNAEWQLYDLSKNRTETKNVADSQPSKVTLMSRKWEAWAHLTGVSY